MGVFGAREINTESAQDKRAGQTEYTTDTRFRFIDQFSSNPWLQHLVILLVAALISLPCLFNGLPPGHDSSTHVLYQHHFSYQFWNGDVYPRWLADANKGYGSPIFLIQYPLPYYSTALLRPLTHFPATESREVRELGVLVFIIIVSAGMSMRFWLINFSPPPTATAAAIAYMSLPYFLVCVYVRAAMGELFTLALMPLALGLCETVHKKLTSITLLGVVLSMLITSNILISVLFTPLLVVYTVYLGKANEIPLFKRVVPILLAAILAAGIASSYLLPVIAYHPYFDLGGLTSNLPDFESGRYFLYLSWKSLNKLSIVIGLTVAVCLALVSGRQIWFYVHKGLVRTTMVCTLLLGTLTLVPDLGPMLIRSSTFSVSSFDSLGFFSVRMMLILFATLALGLVSYSLLSGQRTQRAALLLVAACVSFVLMLPFSAPIWNAFPLLEVIQFPFRLGGILTVAVTGLVALALDSCFGKRFDLQAKKTFFTIGIALLFVIGGGVITWNIGSRMLSAESWPLQPDKHIDVMYRTYISPRQLHQFAERLGTRPDLYEAVATSADYTFRADVISGQGSIRVVRESPRSLFLSTDCRGEVRLRISQLYFPLWSVARISDTSDEITIGPSPEGLIELSFLSSGRQDLRLIFDGGYIERWGAMLTTASLLLTLILHISFYLWTRRGE